MMRHTLFLLILALLLVGCGQTTDVVPASTDLVPTTGGTSTTDVVSTDLPTSTPTPLPGLVLIGGMDVVAPEILSTIETLSGESGWTVETTLTVDAAGLRPETRVILWLGDPAAARPLAEAAPQARVIAVSPSAAVEATPNLTWIVTDLDQQAFAAGYISMLVTQDWRAGGLLPAEPGTWSEAFLNGGRYLCGRCIPLYAPIVEFPVASNLPAGAGAPAALEALNALNSQYYLDTVFVHPGVSSPELLAGLAGQEYIFVGLQSPPEELKARWAATVSFDLPAALRQAWPQADAAGAVIQAPLALQDINPEILTEGKIKLLNQVLQDLQQGLIAPLSIAP
jgi:hypothetical protein